MNLDIPEVQTKLSPDSNANIFREGIAVRTVWKPPKQYASSVPFDAQPVKYGILLKNERHQKNPNDEHQVQSFFAE